jgi:hypothetical protein
MTITGPEGARVDDNHEEHVRTYPKIYPLGLAGLAVAWFFLGLTLLPVNLAGYVNVGLVVWALDVLHFVEGFTIVPADEIGGIYFLGVATMEVSGFPVVLPLGVCRLVTYTLHVFEVRVPTDPEKVYRTKKGEEAQFIPANLLAEGYRPPIRVPFAKKRTSGKVDKEDPLEKRSTNEVSFYARLQIQNFFDFDIRIGSMKAAEDQVEGIGVNFVNSELVQMTVAEALEKLEEHSTALESTLREKTKYWGVKIITAKIRLIEFSRSFNTAMEAVPEAEAGRQKTILDGEGEGSKKSLVGKGDAEAERFDLEERAAGLKKMSEDLGVSVETILAAETARAIAGGDNEKIILPGFEGLTGVVEAISKGFGKAKTTGGSTT